MSDLPDLPKPWYVTLLDWLVKTAKDNWSGLAMIFFNYEEKKVQGAKQKEQDAALKEALAENENAVLKKYAGKSADDILHEFGKSSGDDPSKPDS